MFDPFWLMVAWLLALTALTAQAVWWIHRWGDRLTQESVWLAVAAAIGRVKAIAFRVADRLHRLETRAVDRAYRG